MRDIAGIFHWPPAAIEALSIEDLIFWRGQAVAWWNHINTPAK